MIPKRRKFPERLKRVEFLLPSDTWHGHSTETLWAEKLPSGLYRIENSPFFVIGVSFEDVVSVVDHEDTLKFKQVQISGGHSTYRIISHEEIPSELFYKFWRPIHDLGCSYESATFKYWIYAVDVPPDVDVRVVFSLLEEGENAGVWSFEEGHCGHIV